MLPSTTDVTNAASFDKLDYWVNELRSHESSCTIHICACKLDLVEPPPGGPGRKREVKARTVDAFAQDVGAKIWETSSKTGSGIEEMFSTVAKECAEKLQRRCLRLAFGTLFFLHEEAHPCILLQQCQLLLEPFSLWSNRILQRPRRKRSLVADVLLYFIINLLYL
jgi:hypothetical protein